MKQNEKKASHCQVMAWLPIFHGRKKNQRSATLHKAQVSVSCLGTTINALFCWVRFIT